ncbi:MAG: Non-canonical purine NTP pyrophosphatase [Microgenomates bacterium 39_7]|nr:MAG: Non-canonical purine NTP pyrophosphatase [Microgenomates bacterium 39_7]
MKKLLVATHNLGKLVEIKKTLTDLSLEVIGLSSLSSVNLDFSELSKIDVQETGSTFSENAQLKAKFFSTKTNLLTVADDSGLMVEALNGFPGVSSNRWHCGTDHDRNAALLEKMNGANSRAASFITVLCLSDPVNKQEHFFEGEVRGTIADDIMGDEGFGYDPIFIPDGYQQTFAQLGVEVKNELSHRSKALIKLKKHLETLD